MLAELSKTTPGVRRFLEYARSRKYEPLPVVMKPCCEATTLVYATGMPVHTYFLVFQRDDRQKIPRKTLKELIDYRGKDLLIPYTQGMVSVRAEMQPGYMAPFVSEGFSADFTIYLDRRSFEGNNPIAFPVGANGSGFALPSRTIKDLLIGLYGGERVFVRELLP